MATSNDQYQELRQKIDDIDRKLLELLNKRAETAIEIGRLKRVNNEPIYVPEREKAVLEALDGLNKGPMTKENTRGIFKKIIEQIRELEESS